MSTCTRTTAEAIEWWMAKQQNPNARPRVKRREEPMRSLTASTDWRKQLKDKGML